MIDRPVGLADNVYRKTDYPVWFNATFSTIHI